MSRDFFRSVCKSVCLGLTYSILSEIFSRLYHKPVAVYLPAVLVPFVPGKLTYYMMGEFVHGDRVAALDRVAEILCVCGMIALAILLTETVIRLWTEFRKKKPPDHCNKQQSGRWDGVNIRNFQKTDHSI
ncbi:threonine/serine exporter family protein [Allobaculum mucilyticum]|uniref:threonine/serine exporter family protein n=1 Tax=Allobaculum mucilyticum TaxID=2834459 RepID=UPI003BF7D7F6|nr:threonine/serine exporter family protein [Allobaculum mucilyticum]